MSKTGGGRVAGFEIMVTTPSIANLVRENKIYQLESEIQTGAEHGMRQLDSHLFDLVQGGLVDADEAIEVSQNPAELGRRLNR